MKLCVSSVLPWPGPIFRPREPITIRCQFILISQNPGALCSTSDWYLDLQEDLRSLIMVMTHGDGPSTLHMIQVAPPNWSTRASLLLFRVCKIPSAPGLLVPLGKLSAIA